MSLRRKIALWLCPDLGNARFGYRSSAYEWAFDKSAPLVVLHGYQPVRPKGLSPDWRPSPPPCDP